MDVGHIITPLQPTPPVPSALMVDDARPRIGGYVTDEAYDGWARLAAREGVTITALIEVLGRNFGRYVVDPASMDDYGVVELVIDARAVAAQRSGRRRRRTPET